MIKQKTYNFGNLTITQTIDKKNNLKSNDVSRFNGEYWECLSPKDADYSKVFKLLHNFKIANNIN